MLSLIIPTYNEEKNIRKTILKLSRILKPYEHEIIIADDGSSDKTVDIARELKQKIVKNNTNMGRGYTIQHALKFCKGDYIIYTDADLSINPEALKTVIDNLNYYDIVIGSKHINGSSLKYPLTRKILSHVYKNLVNVLFNTQLSDYQAGLKGFKRQVLEQIIPNVKASRWSWDTEVLIRALKEGYKVKEIPIQVNEIGKKSSVRLLRDSALMLKELIRMKNEGLTNN